MFDSYSLRAGDQHHYHRSEVHEHRAPTDASVKLLREMEQAAEKKLLGSYRLEGCPVDCIVHHAYSPIEDEHRFIVQYKLGEQRHVVRHEFRSTVKEGERDARYRVAAELVRKVGEDIASRILGPAMDRALPARLFP